MSRLPDFATTAPLSEDAISSTRERTEDGPPCQIVLQGAELNGILQAFAPLRTSLLDSLLVVGDRGLLVHNAIFGEQVFLPLDHSQFSRYRWSGPTAAFLSLVDQKRSLLSVFRANQYPDLRRVELTVTGQAPFRTLVQRIWTTASDGEAVELASETLMKRELTSFAVLLPQGDPDVQLRLTKPQLTKVVNAVGDETAKPTTFELGPNGKFSVFNARTCVTFAAREEGASSSTSAQVQILTSALKKAGQAAANAKTVYGENTHRTFSVVVDDCSMRAVLRRLQVGGGTLKFFLTAAVPSVCVTATGPNAVSAVFLLKPQRVCLNWLGQTPGSSTESLASQDSLAGPTDSQDSSEPDAGDRGVPEGLEGQARVQPAFPEPSVTKRRHAGAEVVHADDVTKRPKTGVPAAPTRAESPPLSARYGPEAAEGGDGGRYACYFRDLPTGDASPGPLSVFRGPQRTPYGFGLP
ncbi:DNA polymerase processivity subunit [Chimpanzee herpesvirus strain 105640]|uniref:DNA polymerase processivity factor n=1 Tax=Chimpanzee herpesvirus strain 105640 TaxID=332937 RepID=K9MEX1_9ALPH|nr:DNA polymerase processivity subunit [Chimpanzee herpesvirus strain 105640]AFV26931.1 DNA polymerase processivity subunit [Chimpanzee herpesvirus strain 105640]